ncbi:MAG: matrixin family metalloprotease [Candidatus Altiarchaeota archaeon]|nr:matrixin family metalloprotease [Candidatus Altiarchaeota archaeon]
MKLKNLLVVLAVIAVLGTFSYAVPTKDDKSKDIERIDFIHYAKANPGKPAKTETCYKLMGVKWTGLPVVYAVNPANPQGLSADFVTGAISTATETWDAATAQELFSDSYGVDYSAVYGVRDYKNAIVFGDYPNNGVIAVTSVWYNKRTKQILEFDMEFNTRFSWGDATVDPGVMDLQNIATHELGHSVGLSDLYTSSCTAVTMYGYSSEGDTIKRTLEQPDVTGLQKMYGA